MNKDIQGEALLKLWEGTRATGITQEQHARQLGIPYEIYKARFYRAMANRRFERANRPDLFDWSLPVEWVLDWDDFIVVGDVQLPTTDYDFAMLPAYVAANKLQRPRRLIIAGDLFNFDGFSKYENLIALPSIEQEFDAARNVIGLWAMTFDEIYMVMGNHEERMLKALQGQVQVQDIMNIVNAKLPIGKVKATVRDALRVKTSRGDYYIAHGASYRKLPLSVANELAQKEQANIVLHHQHHLAMGMDIYNRFILIDNGGLFDVEKMAYVQLHSKAMAGMSQGFTLVKGGYPYLFGKHITNWRDWL